MFITLEGPEGSGKTTQAQRLVAWLRDSGRQVLAVREPGGTSIGDAVRRILLDFNTANMDARTELLLFCASRAQLVADKVLPHLRSGGIVVCDRFADSTLAYQGYGRSLDLTELRAVLLFATQGLTPDVTFLLDLPVDMGLQRKTSDGDWNRLDAEAIEFHRRVRAGYTELAAQAPNRWVTLKADRPVDEVARRIHEEVSVRLQKSQSH